MRSLTLLWLLAAVSACADPSEVQSLRARKALLEANLVRLRTISADADLYRGAMKEMPLAGMSLDPQEVSARVTKAAVGVAVSVERDPGGGLNVSFSGSAAPARAAVTLVQLALYLPDVSLSQASAGADGFSARGTMDPQGRVVVVTSPGPRAVVPFTEARKLREEVAALEREAQAERGQVGEELATRGLAALAAARSPDRFRQQAAVLQALVAGGSPLAATAELSFQPSLITARGTLTPGRQLLDAVPLFKPDYELQSLSENGGRFELKLSPRATGR